LKIRITTCMNIIDWTFPSFTSPVEVWIRCGFADRGRSGAGYPTNPALTL
jgi:hypothetical protein